MNVRAKRVPSDPALKGAWRELWAAINKARKVIEGTAVRMSVDIKITGRRAP